MVLDSVKILLEIQIPYSLIRGASKLQTQNIKEQH
jgi:hypothetical protein